MARYSSGRLVVEGVPFPFGEGTPFVITGFQRGVATVRGSEFDRVRRHGRAFGRDLKSGPNHTVSIATLGTADDIGELAAALEVAVDRGGDLTHGRLAELWIGDRYCLGRSRDLDADDSGLWDGTAEYAFTFAAESDLWYGEATSTRVRFSVPESGGLTFPAEAPFTFDSGPTQDNGTVRVGGDVATWPVFVIQGPVRNPVVSVRGVGELRFAIELAHDQELVVDCGAGSILRNGVPPTGSLEARGSRLSDMRLAPGSYAVTLRGYDPSGTGFLDVQVSPAFVSFSGGR